MDALCAQTSAVQVLSTGAQMVSEQFISLSLSIYIYISFVLVLHVGLEMDAPAVSLRGRDKDLALFKQTHLT